MSAAIHQYFKRKMSSSANVDCVQQQQLKERNSKYSRNHSLTDALDMIKNSKFARVLMKQHQRPNEEHEQPHKVISKIVHAGLKASIIEDGHESVYATDEMLQFYETLSRYTIEQSAAVDGDEVVVSNEKTNAFAEKNETVSHSHTPINSYSELQRNSVRRRQELLDLHLELLFGETDSERRIFRYQETPADATKLNADDDKLTLYSSYRRSASCPQIFFGNMGDGDCITYQLHSRSGVTDLPPQIQTSIPKPHLSLFYG